MSCLSETPDTSFKLVNGIVNSFIEETNKTSRSDTDVALEFIKKELEKIESELRDAENKVQNFEEELKKIADSNPIVRRKILQ